MGKIMSGFALGRNFCLKLVNRNSFRGKKCIFTEMFVIAYMEK